MSFQLLKGQRKECWLTMASELKSLLLDSNKKIEEYSTFNLKTIGEVMAKLATSYENETYSYQQTHYFCKYYPGYFHNENDAGNEIYVKHPAFIINDSIKRSFYSFKDYDLKSYQEEGKVLILIDDLKNMLVDSISFYTFDEKTNKLKSNVYFGNFAYLKAFIDEVILYKIKNNLTNISNAELQNIVNNFLDGNHKKIKKL